MILVVSLTSTFPAAASAESSPGARFVYELCDSHLPGGAAVLTTFFGNPGYVAFQDCSLPGGAVGLRPGTAAVGTGAAAIDVTVQATPGGFVESDTITAYSANMQPGNADSWAANEHWPPQDNLDHTRTFPLRTAPPPSCDLCGLGGTFRITMGCREAECAPTGEIAAHYIAATEVDPVPPVVGKLEGSILSGTTMRGHQTVTASATDLGGGLSVLEVLVNGIAGPDPVAGPCAVAAVSNPSYHGVAAYSPAPCPPELKGAWNLDTAAAPFHEGANSLQVCASDFATTGAANTTCSPPQTVIVDDSCIESSVAGGENLDVQFKGSGSDTVTVPFEEAAEVEGSLTGASGVGVAGASICVEAQITGDPAAPRTVGTAITDGAGHFTYDVPAGPNRQLVIGYRHDSFQVTKTLTFGSRARPTLELDHGRIGRGGTVGMTGALPGPGSAGRVVVLQASSLHGKRWLTFRRATTGPRGGFRASYRFGGTSGTTTYRMRALVPRQEGYPWEPGHSIPRRIKVYVRRKHANKKKRRRRHEHRRPSTKKKNVKHPHGGIGA